MTYQIYLGERVGSGRAKGPEIICDSAELLAHVHRPWFLSYAERRLGERLRQVSYEDVPCEVAAPDELFAKHCLMVASTGGGKTRTGRLILSQLMQLGCSVVAFAPKFQDVVALAGDAQVAGLAPEQLSIASPKLDYVLGWNVLNAGIPLVHAAGDLATIIEGISPATAPRMSNILQHALIIVGIHRLSIFELIRFLQRDDFRERLMTAEPPADADRADRMAYSEAIQFFRHDFGAMSRQEKAVVVAPALTRLGEVSRSWFLQGIFAARRNTIDLPSFWNYQQVLVIHNDPAALGSETCARFVAGAFMSALFRTAMREPGPNPVVLALDELASTERLVGGTILDALTLGRSLHLRVIASVQFLGQASDLLKQALLSQTAVQLFGRLGADARTVAASLAAGTGSRLARVIVSAASGEQFASVGHPICDRWGRPLKLSASCWQRLEREAGSSERLARIYQTAAKYGLRSLYVRDPLEQSLVELRTYLRGLAPNEYGFSGPRPLSAVIMFPKPVFTGVKYKTEHDREMRLVQLLQSLPPQHAVVRLASQKPTVVRIADVPNRALNVDLADFIHAAGEANGNSPADIEAALESRQQAVDGKRSGPAIRREESDGSLF
jgi:hypothetical protein